MRSTRARALAASAIFGMVGGSLAMTGTAYAAVTLSGSVVNTSGTNAEGYIYVYRADGSYVTSAYAENGTFDIPLEDGAYKLEFEGFDYADEWYRDKADQATADVVTVAGAAQTLAPWTVDRTPNVVGVVRTNDGRPVEGATVEAFDATTGTRVGGDTADRNGAFRVSSDSASVKLRISGADPNSGDQLASEYFNDKPTLATADPIAASAGGTDIGVITLSPGGIVTGRVTSEAGAPLYRARACLVSGGCDYTDANGVYVIDSVTPGEQRVQFTDPLGEYVGEFWNNVPLTAGSSAATPVAVAAGQVVGGIDAALAARPITPPTGVDLSGTVRDQLGGLGIGYSVYVYDTPADPRDRKLITQTVTNRSGQYYFDELDRIAGETEFKVLVEGDYEPREEGDFQRRSIWSGDKLGYETAVPVTAAPRTLDFVQPVAGGVSGSVTSEGVAGKPDGAQVTMLDADGATAAAVYGSDFKADGSYETRAVWPGTYTVRFGALMHVPEWWKDATYDKATTITVRPGQVTTGISAALTKAVVAVERPEVSGDAWVGKTLRVDQGRWNTEADSAFTYEWLVKGAVVGTGASFKVAKKYLGDKIVARVTNDAGFAQGQAVTTSTAKVGYRPKVKAKVTGKRIFMTLKAKPLKAKKVKASVTVYEVKGKKANGELKLVKLGKGKITKGSGVVTLKKALSKGKHKLVYRIKGKGKVGSGDLTAKVKIKR